MFSLPKRAWTEMNKLQGLGLSSPSRVKFILESSPFDNNNDDTPTAAAAGKSDYCFIGRILPNSIPLNQTALKIEIKLSEKYPIQPPTVRILTPIYHLNVLENGEVCLPILRVEEKWKVSKFLDDVLADLLDIIDNPDINMPYNKEVLGEYATNRPAYDRKVLETIKKNILPRN